MGQVTLSGGTIVSPSEFWLVAFDHDTILLSPPQRSEKHYFPLGQKARGGFAVCRPPCSPADQYSSAGARTVPCPGARTAALLPPPALRKHADRPHGNQAFCASAPAEPRNLENNLSLCHPLFIAVYCVRSCSISRERDVVLFRSF